MLLTLQQKHFEEFPIQTKQVSYIRVIDKFFGHRSKKKDTQRCGNSNKGIYIYWNYVVQEYPVPITRVYAFTKISLF